MSKDLILIRRKSDGKIFRDIINDTCNVHNIYDDDGTRIVCDYDYNIGYREWDEFHNWSDFEKTGIVPDLTAKDVMIDGVGFDRIKPVTQAKR